MSQIVEYILTLKDDLSRGIEGANGHVNQLESSLGSVKSLLTTLGVGFAIFKGAEFLHEGVESAHRLEQSMAQVEAGLKSTSEAAGMTKETISDMAKEMSSRMKFGRADILDMQAQMLTFGGLTKENFPAIGDAIANVATKIGMDLHGMAIQFGKAMDNPSDGIKKLMRQGVMFSQQQEDAIDKLVAKGNIVGAQQIMLTEIANKYGGASQAAFDADPLSRYDKTMGSVKLSVGLAGVAILKELVPTLESLAGVLKSGTEFIKKHGESFFILGKSILAAYVAFQSISLAIPIISALGYAMEGLAYSMLRGQLTLSGFTATMATALGPITIIAAAVGGLVLVFSKLGAAIKSAQEEREKFLGNSAQKEIDYLQELSKMKGGGKEEIGAEKASLQMQLKDLRSELNTAKGERLKELNDGVSETLVKMNAVDRFQQGLIPSKNAITPKKEEVPAKTKAVGSKSVTINVSIKDLVGIQNINTTNLKEGAAKIKELVTNVLAEAVNDFQVAALNH